MCPPLFCVFLAKYELLYDQPSAGLFHASCSLPSQTIAIRIAQDGQVSGISFNYPRCLWGQEGK